jgi:lactoylglutathione lyase
MLNQLGVGLTDIFETHVYTTDLPRAMAFYGEALGLPLAYLTEERQIAFYWIGAPGHAMLGVWGVPAERWQRSHFAFAIHEEQIATALAGLRAAGVQPLDFFGEPSMDPTVHTWMPACGIFFRDPDGNSLELLAMLSDQPRPDLGPLPLSVWRRNYAALAPTH